MNLPYRLTCQYFSNYSQRMENELNTLTQLIQINGKLHAENHHLRQELAHAVSNNRQYSDKMESAKARLERLLITLPEDQA
jgi:cell division protein ZapB